MANTFTCAVCKETFECGQSEEEAVAELQQNYNGQLTPSDCDDVCDDCYAKLPDWVKGKQIQH